MNETYLPYAVGDGQEHTLNLCAYSGWTSTFVPSAAALEVFDFFKDNARVVGQMRVLTQRLDDIAEVNDIDFLKIDIQGGELAVFVHGKKKLKNAVVIQTELQFVNSSTKSSPRSDRLIKNCALKDLFPTLSQRSRSGLFLPYSSKEIPLRH